MLRHEAHQGQCTSCGKVEGSIRCLDCFATPSLCTSCTLASHTTLPFHRMEKWDQDFYRSTTLNALGFVLRLGHSGQPCPTSQSQNGDFAANFWSTRSHCVIEIVHTTGVFRHTVELCSCHPNLDAHAQLFNAQVMPSTFVSPQTAFTFQVLEAFQIANLEGKVSAFSYFQQIRRATNNAFPALVPVGTLCKDPAVLLDINIASQDKTAELRRLSRQWRDLQRLKRFGYGHGEDGTPALFCASCPQPGVNLPPGWEDTPDQFVPLHMKVMLTHMTILHSGGSMPVKSSQMATSSWST